jgi:hypothetical protein
MGSKSSWVIIVAIIGALFNVEIGIAGDRDI